MKRQLSLKLPLLAVLLMLLGMPLTAGAYDFMYNNVCFNVTSEEDKACEVTKSPYGYIGSWSIPANPLRDGVAYTCTAVGDKAFAGCTGLVQVFLPGTITRIGECAFEGCTSLTSFTMPNTVTTMGLGAFEDCSALQSVQWSTGMTDIPGWTFYGCSSLVDFMIPHWIQSVGLCSFALSGLEQVVLPYGLKRIGERAFRNSVMTTVLIPSSVTEVASDAFLYCDRLAAFYCNMPTPPSLSFDGISYSCRFYVPVEAQMQYISAIPDRSVEAGAYDFNYGTGYDPATSYHMTVTSAEPVTLDGVAYDGTAKYVFHPNIKDTWGFTPGVAEMDNMCGSGKRYLITEVGDSAFSQSSLSDLDFVACHGLTRVGHNAFWQSSLKHLRLPAGVTEYGEYAIYFMTRLTDLYVMNPTPAQVAANTFSSSEQQRATLHVPTMAAVKAYRNAEVWKEFLNIVSESSIPGDVDGDNEVNISDVNAVIDIILGGDTDPAADVNGDGEVNIGDVNAVIDIILG